MTKLLQEIALTFVPGLRDRLKEQEDLVASAVRLVGAYRMALAARMALDAGDDEVEVVGTEWLSQKGGDGENEPN